MKKSAYLEHPRRLADVIALLQVMGSYRYATRQIAKWHETIGREPVSGRNWASILEAHPEFFRVKGELATLVWRRAYDRNFDPDSERNYKGDELTVLDEQIKDEISFTRRPLSSEQVSALIESAIKMHSAAIAYNQELRWRAPLLSAILGMLIGVVFNGYKQN